MCVVQCSNSVLQVGKHCGCQATKLYWTRRRTGYRNAQRRKIARLKPFKSCTAHLQMSGFALAGRGRRLASNLLHRDSEEIRVVGRKVKGTEAVTDELSAIVKRLPL